MASHFQQDVRRRRVFYIPGYDPIPPRRYRELYRSESARQAEISGYEIKLTGRQDDGVYGWNVEADIGTQHSAAEIDVLLWSDLVRDSMNSSIPATYLMLARTAWTYIASGTLRRLMWLRKGPVIAALYPVAMLLLQLVLALLVASIAGSLVAWGFGMLLGLVFSGGWISWISNAVYWIVFAVLLTILLQAFRRVDNKLYAYYLMHDYAYSARDNGAYPPELEARLASFADRITAALQSGVDEVLVVGHSSGAYLGVSLLADLVRARRVPANGPALALLTLGQVIPMVSFLPKADRLRGDLHELSKTQDLTWVDVSAPGDGCAFALCDPVAVTGVDPPEGKRWPLILSAAFTQTLSRDQWSALRWRFFRLHFQYLCAFDQPGDYDYFQITAGPVSLARRYADRQPSRSRIDVAASKYTAMAP